MKYEEFVKSIEKGECASVYLFEGEETFFFESGITLIKNKYIKEPELNFLSLNGDCTLNELLSSLDGYPLMSDKRMTVVREFYPKADFMKGGFKSYIDNPSKESVLLILDTKPCEALKKFSAVEVVDCKKADSSTVTKWIIANCKKEKVEIDYDTARTLTEYCLSDMTRVKTELEKLISYTLKEKVITTKDVSDMVNRDTEYKIYEMTDYVGRKKFDKALDVIKEMLGKGMAPQMLLVSIYNYFRRLLQVAISSMQVSEIAKAMNIKEFAVKKAKEQAGLFKVRALKRAVDMLNEADYSIKSGKTNADEKMWLVIFRIMTEK